MEVETWVFLLAQSKQVLYPLSHWPMTFISSVFEETSAEGDPDESVQHLRTLNIGIKDGKVYQVKDIVNLDGKFAEEWLEAMRDEAGEVNFLAELDEDDMIKTLGGESIDGNYMVNFFVDEEGIEEWGRVRKRELIGLGA